jgi:hypothetical protein
VRWCFWIILTYSDGDLELKILQLGQKITKTGQSSNFYLILVRLLEIFMSRVTPNKLNAPNARQKSKLFEILDPIQDRFEC